MQYIAQQGHEKCVRFFKNRSSPLLLRTKTFTFALTNLFSCNMKTRHTIKPSIGENSYLKTRDAAQSHPCLCRVFTLSLKSLLPNKQITVAQKTTTGQGGLLIQTRGALHFLSYRCL